MVGVMIGPTLIWEIELVDTLTNGTRRRNVLHGAKHISPRPHPGTLVQIFMDYGLNVDAPIVQLSVYVQNRPFHIVRMKTTIGVLPQSIWTSSLEDQAGVRIGYRGGARCRAFLMGTPTVLSGLKVDPKMGPPPACRGAPIMSKQIFIILMMTLYPATIYSNGNLNATTSAKSGIQVQQASSLSMSIMLGLEDVDVTQLQVIIITLNKVYAMQKQIHTPQPPGMRLLLLVIQFRAMHMGIDVTIGLMLVQVTKSVDTPQPTSTILPKHVGISA